MNKKTKQIEWQENHNFSFGSLDNKKEHIENTEDKIAENQSGRHASIYGEVEEKIAEQIINQLAIEEEKKIQQESQSFSK